MSHLWNQIDVMQLFPLQAPNLWEELATGEEFPNEGKTAVEQLQKKKKKQRD